MANEVEDIKQRLDIVEVVREYIEMKKAGSNYKACCPFHQEKSPSFMVSQPKQIWHCFGCHEGGDLFTFVQKMEGLEFYDALKLLADKAGVELSKKQTAEKGKKQHLLDIIETATEFFSAILQKHPKAEHARAYAEKRGLTDETIQQFQIGYAPDAWDTLLKFLLSKGYKQQEIIDAGLVVYNEERRSVYDRFRDRFMIPLRDAHGFVVGFTARALSEDYQGGKYINTPQTFVYDKSRVIFGLSNAKQAIKQAGYAVLVEGNMDVVSSHQAGVLPVVAISGTALTQAQVGLLKRYTQSLIFAFDADDAGFNASLKGIQLALQQGMEVRLLDLPQDKDPDDLIREDVNAWTSAIEQAKPVIDALLEREFADSVEGKKQLAGRCVAVLRHIQNPVERDHYVQKVALVLQVSPASLQEMLRKTPAEQASRQQEEQGSGGEKAAETAKNPQKELYAELMSLLLLEPSLLAETEHFEELLEESSMLEFYKSLKLFYDQSVSTGVPLDFSVLQSQLEPDLQTIHTKLEMYGDMKFPETTPQQRREAFEARKHYLLRQFFKQKLERVQHGLLLAEQQNDRQKITQLTDEFTRLSQELKRLES